MIKNYIIAGLISILIVFGIIVSIKCSKLEKENIKLKIENGNIADSIKIENEILHQKISLLSNDLEYYKHQIDSLNNIKQRVIVKSEYIISNDLIDGAKLLKENLRCER